MLALSLMSLEHKHLGLSLFLASSRCISQIPFFLHLIFHLFSDWTSSLTADFDWLREHRRAESLSYGDKAVVSLFQTLAEMHEGTHTFVHLGIQMCMHTDLHTG